MATSYSYTKMLHQEVISIAQSFLSFEHQILSELLRKTRESSTVIVIGAGDHHYEQLTKKYNLRYIGIEPYLKRKLSPIIQKKLEDFYLKKNYENTIYIFWFNVAFYIDSLEIHLERLTKSGDIVFFSSWKKTQEAKTLMKKYFSTIYQDPIDHINKINRFCIQDSIKKWKKKTKNQEVYSNSVCNIDIFFK